MRIGIFAPRLLTYGGGEKYICKIAEILSRQHTVDLLTFTMREHQTALVLSTLESRLNVDLRNVRLKALSIPSIAKHLPYANTIMQSVVFSKNSKKYDLFVNQSRQLPFVQPARANKNIIIIEEPVSNVRRPPPFDYRGVNLLFDAFFDTSLSTYDKIIVNSKFVKTTVDKKYAREAQILYPPIDILGVPLAPKERVILSVGRFYTGWHSKKQLEMIQAFKQLCDEARLDEAGWEYHLVGGVSNQPFSQEYKEICKQEALRYPIFFHFNAPFGTLRDLYKRAALFWHATGFDVDEDRYPEKTEHFGIATAEAMSLGCVPIVVRKGGQPEIVHHGVDGLLWCTLDELKKYTLRLINDPDKRDRLADAAIETSRRFGADEFGVNVMQLFS